MDNGNLQLAQDYRSPMKTTEQLNHLHLRLRRLRESKNLTLADAAHLSKGSITAIALGSYERGDRSISVGKLITIAEMYGLPISELFTAPEREVLNSKTTLDIRKLKLSESELSHHLSRIVRRIATLRSDWNGEVISLRSDDLTNLSIFGGISADQIDLIHNEFTVPRSK